MYYASRIANTVAGVLGLLGLGAAGWFSVLLARADREFRQGTPEAVERAVELAPRNTAYLSRRALEIDYDGGDARPLLQRMAVLNPLSSAPRIRLGLDAEVRGDTATARRWLLDAARVDRQFEPAWTLANFYYRQDMPDEFWKWMHAALEVSYGDRRPAFDLCWRVASNPSAQRDVLSRAIPNRREVLAAYLSYLLQNGHLAAIVPAATKLAAWRNRDDLPLLYSACDTLLDAGDGAAGLDVWAALGQPEPSGIVSPDFDAPRIGYGFDWRMIDSPGVTHVTLDAPPALRLVFSGQQPESCELLRQFVKLRAGRNYTLRWEARTSGFSSPTGMEWRIAEGGHSLSPSDDWTAAQAVFTAAREWTVLTLRYQRPSGEPRAEGTVEIRHVSLAESP